MASSRNGVWRKAMDEHADRWSFDDANGRGGGKPRWTCKCGHKVFHANTPKDRDGSLQAHLRLVRRHEATCTA